MLENKTFKFCLGAFCSIGGVFIVFILINSILRGDSIDPNKTYGPSHNYQIPEECDGVEMDTITEEDIMVLDTMLIQVQDIEKDIDTLHVRMDRIEHKIDIMLEEQDD
jgi:hypothetical protein